MSEPASARLVRAHLEGSGLREREGRVVRLVSWLFAAAGVLGLALAPLLGSRQALLLVGALTGLSLFERWLSGRIAAGLFFRALPWLDTVVEVSTPVILLALDELFHGPEFALTREGLVVFAAMVLVSALRLRVRLALFAGALAAALYLGFYFVVCLPHLPLVRLATLEPRFAVVRAGLLLAAGGLAALIVSHLVSLAQTEVRRVRERDLMGKYLVHERIGAGGMAEVFRATYSPEGGFEKQVAIKRVLPAYAADPEFLELFRREVHLGSLLSHQNVIQILDVGRQDDNLFMAMEYVDGLSLFEAMWRLLRPLPLGAAAFLGAELGEALDYIHNRSSPNGQPLGLVHSDVNPGNILVSRYGEVKLADFGIARAIGSAHPSDPDILRGKLCYVAPEQLARGDPDRRSDLFALGLTLREALTGRRLFGGKTDAEILAAIRAPSPLPRASIDRPEVPEALDLVVAGLLQRDPAHRIASGQEVRTRLCLLGGAAAPYPHGKGELAAFVQEALARAPPVQQPVLGRPADPDKTRRVSNPMEEAWLAFRSEPSGQMVTVRSRFPSSAGGAAKGSK